MTHWLPTKTSAASFAASPAAWPPCYSAALCWAAQLPGSFYGVNQLLPDSSNGQTVSAQTTSGVLTSLGSTSGTSTRYGMDVSDVAESALPGVVAHHQHLRAGGAQLL